MYLSDQVVSEVSVTVKKHKMPLLSKLFPVWFRGHRAIWSSQRGTFGFVENYKVQSLFQRRV